MKQGIVIAKEGTWTGGNGDSLWDGTSWVELWWVGGGVDWVCWFEGSNLLCVLRQHVAGSSVLVVVCGSSLASGIVSLVRCQWDSVPFMFLCVVYCKEVFRGF